MHIYVVQKICAMMSVSFAVSTFVPPPPQLAPCPTKPHAHSAPLPRQAVPPSPAVPTTAQSTPGKPVFEGQAAASAKRIRTWLNHLSGNLMSAAARLALVAGDWWSADETLVL